MGHFLVLFDIRIYYGKLAFKNNVKIKMCPKIQIYKYDYS